MRRAISILVWLGATGGATWLALHDPAVADAPAHVMAKEFRISAVEAGRIAELTVRSGDRVRAGQLLARLDTSVLEREIAVAEARIKQVGAELSASASVMESDGYQTERSFQVDFEEVTSQLEAARAAEKAQRAELETLREEGRRLRQLVKEGLARTDRADEMDVRRKVVEQAVQQWPERIRELQKRQREVEQRLAEWRGRHTVATNEAVKQVRLRPYQDRTAEQMEALRVLRTRLQNARLTAPEDAEVVTVLAQPGDVARAGEPFLVLHAASTRMVVAYVAERDGNRVTSGSPALLHRRTRQREEFTSKVVRVADTVVQLPPRFWTIPTMPQWGREVYLEVPANHALDTGEAVDVKFTGTAPSFLAWSTR